jgi:hypothetical protein
MDKIQSYIDSLISDKFRFIAEDVNFLISEYKANDSSEEKIIVNATGNFSQKKKK